MPSGAKKRKAAKRKKLQQQSQTQSKFSDKTNYNITTLHGNEVQLQNKQESKCTEVGNPVSQDQQQIKNDNEKRDPPSVRSSDDVKKSQDNRKGQQSDEGAVEVIKALKSVEDSDNKNLSNENVKSAKELHDGDKSSSKGSGPGKLGGESRVAEKRSKVKANDSVTKTNEIDGPVNSIDYLSKEVAGTDETSVDEINSSVLDRAPIVDSARQMVPASASKKAVPIPGSSPVEKLPASRTAESSLKENEKKPLQKSNGGTVVSLAKTKSAAVKTEDKSVRLSDETAQASSTTMMFIPEENEAALSSAAHGTQAGNADNIRECHGCCDSGPSVPLAVRKTPWWNCCGLFDAATSSDR